MTNPPLPQNQGPRSRGFTYALWGAALAGTLLLAACSSTPAPPAWQGDAKDSLERANAAFLEGNTRVALAEMTRVRRAISGTGRADWLAHAELAHCAARTASLVLGTCSAFDALRTDATRAQHAYADYLSAKTTPETLALLPAAQQPVAAQTSSDATALSGITNPLSRLVGAAVLLQKGQASPPVIELAIDTASQQGWRRPLLAWLGVQTQRAEQAGDGVEVDRLRRRMALVESSTQPAR